MDPLGVSLSLVHFSASLNHSTTLRLNATDNGIGMSPEEMTKNLVRARANQASVPFSDLFTLKRERLLNPELRNSLRKLKVARSQRPTQT